MNRLFGNRSEPDDETPLIATADEEIRPQIVQIFALVGEAMAGATHALLSGDRELAKNVVEKDKAIDTLVNSIVNAVELQLIENESLNIADRRRLLILLRILPEVERSGDLAEHIARRAARGLGVEMSPRSRGLVERMVKWPQRSGAKRRTSSSTGSWRRPVPSKISTTSSTTCTSH